ncbi:hypothetical protein DS6A_65 [Mycobacterium phage DS6A]|uniref:Uncharacterized protein n=1 Tax=Mycobacterium phage DS6A TaxID=45764 RepID=G8I4H5_9CAUD|nr:hypothetical protein DS6A_65 [Mycobacterium phage DS6A]AER47619.1 hypothetical protein DS6A_65 [Mycobacterium phage DS6A]
MTNVISLPGADTASAAYDRAAADRARRFSLTGGKAVDVLAEHRPAIIADGVREAAVAAYLRVSREVLSVLTVQHRDELTEAGYEYAAGLFSRRAILHVALLLAPGQSDRADMLRRTLGDWASDRPFRPGSAPTAVVTEHEVACRDLIGKASELVEQVHDGDAGQAWADLEALDRHTLQGLAVALAAMVNTEEPVLRHCLIRAGLRAGEIEGVAVHPSRAAAFGLAALVPTAGAEAVTS